MLVWLALAALTATLPLSVNVPVTSQSSRPAFTGRVFDVDGKGGVANLEVKLTPPRASNLPIRVATTDSDGAFRFANLDQGEYLLEVSQGVHLLQRFEIDTRQQDRIDIPLRRRTSEAIVYVSVQNRVGAPVLDVKSSEFLIREDGVRRDIISAERAREPMDVVIVVDNGDAASDAVLDIRKGLHAFVRRMSGTNSLALMTAAGQPTILVDYTTNAAEVERGVDRIFGRRAMGSNLLQALMETSRALRARESVRKVILAIATESSEQGPHFKRVIAELQSSGAALYALVLISGGSGSLDKNDRNVVLADGPRITGGRRINVLASMGLTDQLVKVAAELSNQYRIVYARSTKLVAPKKLEVSVARPGLTARGTRGGDVDTER